MPSDAAVCMGTPIPGGTVASAAAIGRLGSLPGRYVAGVMLPAGGTAGVFAPGAFVFAAAVLVLVLGEKTRARTLEAISR
jgi:hypothetical protein